MRKATALMCGWQADTQSGESLHFELCKGGYFSNREEYGLKVTGRTLQDGTPTPDNPLKIQCVKAGTKIICGNSEIITPCNLYKDDIWYVASGKVLRSSFVFEFSGDSSDSSIGTDNWGLSTSFAEGINGFGMPTTKFYTGTSVWSMGNILSTHFRALTTNYNMLTTTYPSCVMHFDRWRNLLFIAPADDFPDLASWKAWLAAQKENGSPVTVCLKLKTPEIEQYEPQPIFAQSGTVNVLQLPIDLSADLEATMLKK